MKVIEMLNKIANGEIPEKIKYDDKIWHYENNFEDYITDDDSRIDWRYTIMEYINDEVEVIEDKKIEKLEPLQKEWMSLDDIKFTFSNSEMIIVNKINEIIDKLNDLEK